MLNELDGFAVRISHPSRAEIGKQVVRWTERGRTVGRQTSTFTVDIVSPEHDLERRTVEVRIQLVISVRGFDGDDYDLESLQASPT
jgi:hypothetical protein